MSDFEIALNHYVNLACDNGLSWPTTLEARKALVEYVQTGHPSTYIQNLPGIEQGYGDAIAAHVKGKEIR